MIHDEIVTYEVAKLAKEKGFNEECRDFYCNDKRQKRITRTSCNRQVTSFDYCSNSTLEDYDSPKEYFHIAAPTQSLLQRWLREEKGIQICIDNELDFGDKDFIYEWRATLKKEFRQGCFTLDNPSDMEFYPTYEEALTAAFKYALENLV